MRILIATSRRVIIGGLEQYLHVLIPELLNAGHHVAMLYDRPAGSAGTMVDPQACDVPIWFCEELERSPALWKALMEWKADVVYSHGLECLGVEQVLLETHRNVMYVHDYARTCNTGRKCYTFPGTEPCSRRFGPACLVLHYPRRCGGLNPWRALRMYQTNSCRSSKLVNYSAVAVASRHMYHELQQHGVGLDNLHVLPLPVTSGVPQLRELTARPFQGRLLFVGRLADLKGAHYLMQALPVAAAQLGRPLSLTVAGEGPERQNLMDLARRIGIHVDFPGWVEARRKAELMCESDLLVVPSLWPEPFGLVGIEAGSQGLPAVAYDTGGIPDWLIPGQSGELAPAKPPTIQGLADAIVRALADPRHYAELCRGAWDMSQRFTMQKHLTALERILDVEISGDRLEMCTSVVKRDPLE